ncbi:helix-hairpin-helix domain-containing protein, partial [candidate division KSB1 bacterium]|nr:helix-hairpin-helix domain-containing protein [candidate division KSB1 bacterium]
YRRSLPPPPVEPALLESLRAQAHHITPDTQRLAPRASAAPLLKSIESPLNLNTATFEELVRLPGVGEVLARRIIEYRTQRGKFRHVEELERVKGLGKSKVLALKAYVVVP